MKRTYLGLKLPPAIRKGLTPPVMKPITKRTSLDMLIECAKAMEPGDAVALRLSETNTMRIILNAQGFDCATDGWQCEDQGKTLLFKLNKPASKELEYEI